ncbi:hypothetical protein FW774_00450 (plasmid) [Pedobacter sp. BS3]|uniref:hypothetical protein n=1 Tax=Pedobacter sp. BS3 TaxID=2567937 RepID=UPI0011ED42D9|nr:hypothetical protein [Pedobacter sp. BS3]TZF85584.1 hypothetical protein FW774_00450 [Pedobacter sp. BS3]
MKNNMLKLGLALFIMGIAAAGCGSSRETSGSSDSTMVDSSTTTPPDPTRMDTTRSRGADTVRTDSTM